MFEKKDANGDGSLTLEELKAGMKGKALDNAEKRFEKLDKDGDGKVSLEEFKAGMGQQKKKKWCVRVKKDTLGSWLHVLCNRRLSSCLRTVRTGK